MSGIQLILLTGVIFIGLYFLVRLKKRLLDILLLVVLVAAAAIFIVWPNITSMIANKLGVGRGVDLVFYLSILIFWFVVLKLYSRIRKLEQLVTTLIRQDALNHRQELPDASPNKDKQ
jgi:small membrane protein